MTALEIVTTDITGTTQATAYPGPGTIVTTQPATTVVVNEEGIQGPPGPPGAPGPDGPGGPAGAGHDPVLFTQDMPATVWVIPHPFPGRPVVVVSDHLGDVIQVEITHSPGVVTIRTERPSTGSAYLI